MLRDIAGIRIKGAGFTTDTDLLIFNSGKKNDMVKGSLIYGRNGAGKSTISKGIRKIIGEDIETISKAEFIDINNNAVAVDENEKKNVFVFDEEYVNSKVKIQESGLGTIVMLGDLVDLSEQLDTANKELELASKNYEDLDKKVNEYKDYNNDKSPYYYLVKMNNSLSGDRNWAGRERQIKGHRKNASVKNDTYLKFTVLNPSKGRDELLLEFNGELKKLSDAESGAAEITADVPKIPPLYVTYNDEEAKNLILLGIQKPELSEREKYLLRLVQDCGIELLQKSIDIFSSPDTQICPTCLQKVTTEYKDDLVASIKKVLSKKVEKHQNNLREKFLRPITLNLNGLESLASHSDCINAITKLNDTINSNNQVIQNKIDDPYNTPANPFTDISPLIKSLEKTLKQLSDEMNDFNKKIADTKPLIAKLTQINSELAYYDIKEYYDKYKVQSEESEKIHSEYNDAKRILEEKKTAVVNIENERKKTKVALDVLNKALKYIFFSEKRMSIEQNNEEYIILVNGQNVKPKDISVGERNILGLCYFFTSILNGKDKTDGYTEEYLIVIDDPISSFDIENKVGIMSYLKHELNQFMTGNKDTRAIIFTHDLMTRFDSLKIFQEVIKECGLTFPAANNNKSPFKYISYELRNKVLKEHDNNKRNDEYTELLNIIFKYATETATEYDIVIGNIMRQVLEAFSTFTYKKGIVEVSTDKDIIETIDEKYRDYFENLMYRLVLNGGSHRQEQTQSLEVDFFQLITENEKRRTAKDILTFIYLLNKRHILAHLGNDADSELQEWCNDIMKL